MPIELRLLIEPLRCGNGVRLVSFFVFLQGRNFHQRAFGIGAMHGLAIVTQGFLGEALRVCERDRRCADRAGIKRVELRGMAR